MQLNNTQNNVKSKKKPKSRRWFQTAVASFTMLSIVGVGMASYTLANGKWNLDSKLSKQIGLSEKNQMFVYDNYSTPLASAEHDGVKVSVNGVFSDSHILYMYISLELSDAAKELIGDSKELNFRCIKAGLIKADVSDIEGGGGYDTFVEEKPGVWTTVYRINSQNYAEQSKILVEVMDLVDRAYEDKPLIEGRWKIEYEPEILKAQILTC